MNVTRRKFLSIIIVAGVLMLNACSSEEGKVKSVSENQSGSSVESILTFQQGKHYEKLAGLTLTALNTNDNAEENSHGVTEFFWYGCAHCRLFAPALTTWEKSHAGVKVNYLPIVWNETTELHAKIFFLIRSKESFSDLHKAMFDIVAGLSRTDSLIKNKTALITQLEELGITAMESTKAMETGNYAKEMAAVRGYMKTYQITGVPSLIVNGEMKIINKNLNSMNQALLVIDALLKSDAE